MTKRSGGARRVLRAFLGAGMTAALVAGCGGSPGTAAPASTAKATEPPVTGRGGAIAAPGGLAELVRA